MMGTARMLLRQRDMDIEMDADGGRGVSAEGVDKAGDTSRSLPPPPLDVAALHIQT